MPKMKTRKAAAKRYSLTGTGKVKYKKRGCGISLQRRRQRESVISATAEFSTK